MVNRTQVVAHPHGLRRHSVATPSGLTQARGRGLGTTLRTPGPAEQSDLPLGSWKQPGGTDMLKLRWGYAWIGSALLEVNCCFLESQRNGLSMIFDDILMVAGA